MRKPVILCVDDEKSILDSLKKQLKLHFENEYNIEAAESGEEALELVTEFLEDGLKCRSPLPIILCRG